MALAELVTDVVLVLDVGRRGALRGVRVLDFLLLGTALLPSSLLVNDVIGTSSDRLGLCTCRPSRFSVGVRSDTNFRKRERSTHARGGFALGGRREAKLFEVAKEGRELVQDRLRRVRVLNLDRVLVDRRLGRAVRLREFAE